jgi:hypothetical protein
MGKSNELTTAMAITCALRRRRLIETTTYALLGGMCVYILVRAEVVVSFTPF